MSKNFVGVRIGCKVNGSNAIDFLMFRTSFLQSSLVMIAMRREKVMTYRLVCCVVVVVDDCSMSAAPSDTTAKT